MKFPNDQQVAILLKDRTCNLEQIVHAFLRALAAKHGIQLGLPEAKPGVFYRCYGGREMTVSFELLERAGDPAVFAQAMASSITTILCDDVRERLASHHAMILINVSHGVLGGVMKEPRFAQLFADIGMAIEGENLPQFIERLEVAALAGRIALDHCDATLVHWTQSNQLLRPDVFDVLAGMSVPSHLHVHPWLWGSDSAPGEAAKAGFRTFGLRHFLGREVIVEANVIPWAANLETVLAFTRFAIGENGYIIPDGDTFGPEGGGLLYKVTHRNAEDDGFAVCELAPLIHREYDFLADGYVPPRQRVDDRAPPLDRIEGSEAEKQAVVEEWREKRAMAERAGARFEVKMWGGTDPSPSQETPKNNFGKSLRARLFGRRGL